MTYARIDYCVTLEVMSPLHVGTGEVVRREHKGKDGETEHHDLALISYGVNKEQEVVPAIPGPSIKGVMRDVAKGVLEDSDISQLFGEIKNTDKKTGAMGAVYFWGGVLDKASLRDQPIQAGDGITPLANYKPDTGVFEKARTAIDSGRGISEPNKLFHAQFVAKGAKFYLEFRLEGEGLDPSSFERVLKGMATERGFVLGGSTTQGFGRVRFIEATKTPWNIQRGVLAKGDAESLDLIGGQKRKVFSQLRFHCPGPFYILDHTEIGKAKTDEERENSIQQRAARDQDEPLVIGSEIKGILRSKYAWKLACDHPEWEDEDINQAVERLFGSHRNQGLFRLWVRRVSRKNSMTSTSVKIDRFSGGSFASGLFSADVDYDVRFDLEIEIIDRRIQDDDETALKELIEDIIENGMEIGHRINNGFGWFDVGSTTNG